MIDYQEIKLLISEVRKYVFSEYFAIKDLIVNKIISKYIDDEENLKKLKEEVLLDLQTYLENDPSVDNIGEIVYCYPGLYATMCYRLSNLLIKKEIEIIPRMISELAHSRTGIDIHPKCKIGKSFFIDHGTGVVIGATTVIGDNVKIYHGVTLGAKTIKKVLHKQENKRHPTIEDNVTIYANATVLGKDTVIGHDSIIGCNSVVKSSVPPYSIITYKNNE